MSDYEKTRIEFLLNDNVVLAIEAAAWNNGRSLLEEIVTRLERGVSTENQTSPGTNIGLFKMAGETAWMAFASTRRN